MSTPPPLNFQFLFSHPAHMFALGFGSGLSPKAPGTAGTLFAWLIFVIFSSVLNELTWGIVIAASFVIGIWACQITALDMKIQDPGSVVWDEIVAFWLILWLISPTDIMQQLIAFILFRLFDAVKIGPVGWADKKFKGWSFRGAFGIMFDDLVAAFLTLLVMAIGRLLL